MSISSTTRKAGPFSGNGVTVAFPFTYKVFQTSDVLVVRTDTSGLETTLTLTTDYTVALNANQDANPGGSVTMVVAPPTGYLLTLGSQVTQTQPLVLTNTGGFYPTVINDALDRLTIFAQQIQEQVSRAVKVGFSSGISTDTLTNYIVSVYNNLAAIIAVNANQTNIQTVVLNLSAIAAAPSAATAAASSASAASASATSASGSATSASGSATSAAGSATAANNSAVAAAASAASIAGGPVTSVNSRTGAVTGVLDTAGGTMTGALGVQALLEKVTVTAAAPSATQAFDAMTQVVQYFTANAANNFTLNVRGNSGTTLNTMMAVGQSMTIAVLATNGATPYYANALQIDGSAVTPKWQGGTAPTTGNASSVDAYSYTIVKTANATFSAFAAQTKFA